MSEEPSVPASNGKSSNAINWTTIALIILSGGGNFLETRSGNDFSTTEIKRATQEIHELYPLLQEAIQRQKQMQATLDQMQRTRQ